LALAIVAAVAGGALVAAADRMGPVPAAGRAASITGLRSPVPTGASTASAVTTSRLPPRSPPVLTSASSTAASVAPVPAGNVDPDAAIIAVAAAVTPAVVTITSQVQGGFGGPTTGVGSGMLVDPRGIILTNAHVVAGASSVSVQLDHDAALAAPEVRAEAWDPVRESPRPPNPPPCSQP
jgi:S1-C subfamily serine protease